MRPASQLAVPSSNLLKFLRSQAESSSSFFSSSRRDGHQLRPFACAAAAEAAEAAEAEISIQKPPARLEKPRAAALHASMWNLDSLRPLPTPSLRKTGGPSPFPIPTTKSQQRYSSSSSSSFDFKQQPKPSDRKTWHDKVWGLRRGRVLKPGDLSDDSPDFTSMFNARRLPTAKAALEPRIRCTEVNEEGEVILVDGEFKKTELIAKYGLLPRDLRKIDSSNLPHILVRPAAILLNLLHLKVLIKADRVLLFDVYGSRTSYPQSAFIYDLQGKLQQKQTPSGGVAGGGGGGGLPYEFRALEAVLMSVTSELESDFDSVQEPVLRILSELEDDITREKLRVLLTLTKKLSTFEQKAKLVRDAIEELLEADDDLAAMYLTEKKHDLFRGEDDHTEVEMLLESYHKICDEVVQEASALVSAIRQTEEITRAILDANRNSLMLLELKFSIGTLGLAMGTFLAGLYGMNLENFIEETNWGFAGVTGASMFFSLIVCWYGLVKLRKVQRVKMRGADGRGSDCDPHWYNDDRPSMVLEARHRERLKRMHMIQKSLNPPKKKWWFQ